MLGTLVFITEFERVIGATRRIELMVGFRAGLCAESSAVTRNSLSEDLGTDKTIYTANAISFRRTPLDSENDEPNLTNLTAFLESSHLKG